MLVDEIDVDRVLREINDTSLQRRVHAAERHMNGLRAVGRKHRVLSSGRLDTHLRALQVFDLANFLATVQVAKPLRSKSNHMYALDGIIDHIPDGRRSEERRVGKECRSR